MAFRLMFPALPAGLEVPNSLEGWLELAADDMLLEAVFDYTGRTRVGRRSQSMA